jgi:molybdopterin molybdotransferase
VSVDWFEARRIAGSARPLRARPVLLSDAHGAILAAPLIARTDSPTADNSAMDGYAIRGAGPWNLRGQTLAGGTPPPAIGDGEAWEVATGVPVPLGCDAILPTEAATCDAQIVCGEAEPGRHIRRRGEEWRREELLLEPGSPVGPVVVALAAAAGCNTLTVIPRPRIVIEITGDELVTRGIPGPGQVRDALGPMLLALLDSWRTTVVTEHRVADDPAAFRAALRAEGDVLVVTGASARGPADHLRPALAEIGAELIVNGVACRPGHPMLLARLPDGRHVVGLPGNPLAALAGAVTLLAPLVAALSGDRCPEPRQELSVGQLSGTGAGIRLVPVRRQLGGGVVATGYAGSAMLRGAALGHAFAIVPESGVEAGSDVLVVPFDA